ncbi:hypothetical protein L198_07264 [Cryptococcus wingfieldii CBS 7118]|uniref:Zn(2)-C6 fungal-type domain-containing protein n=1 Tax=Cryptococcus wingfieldii CBS 7118 TaxID=1295528 RepID=A0A1E3IDC7_9TREE|nr:hypothetical protein L198_07264 [Cryptococcus wingfieldii CBS 7118]ODN86570.1 hypothetical protein L198_07264 [Cryptococcus wingfieldii CBS 7118]
MSHNSGVFPGFPSPSPITYTTTTTTTNNNTSSYGNAPGLQLYDISCVFPASSTPSTINYTSITNDDGNVLGLQLSALTPFPASSGDKPKPKARSSTHVTNTNNIKARGKEKKKHAEGYKRKSMSCEHCRQRRKQVSILVSISPSESDSTLQCDGDNFNACTLCTYNGIECKYNVAKGKRGSQKALKKLAAMGRAPSADGIIIATPSTLSLASSSSTSSMSPITPITPAKSTVELSSGHSPASVSAGHTSGFPNPQTFMPFVPTTQVQPPVSQLSSAVDSNGLLAGWQIAQLQQALLDRVDRCFSNSAAATAASEFDPYEPPTPRTTPVKPTYVRPTDVSPIQAPTFSLLNASVPSTLPAMDVTRPQPQLPAFDPQTLSESERLEMEKLAMNVVFDKGSFSAAPEAPCEAAPVASLATPDTTPLKPTVEMSAVSINLSYADFSEPQPTPWLSAPQIQVEDEAVPEDEEDVDWGMYVNMEEMEEVDDGGSWGALESPFNNTPFGDSFTPIADEAADNGMRGLWNWE